MNQTKHYPIIKKALGYISEHQEQQPNLADVAQHCGLSEHHLQRVFTAFAGVSPKQFLQQLNREALKARLLDGESLLDASHNTGLSSPSRGYDLMIKLEAVSPGELKSKGQGLTFWVGVHTTLFGDCFIALTQRGIHQLLFLDNAEQRNAAIEQLKQNWPAAIIQENLSATQQAVDQLFNDEPSEQIMFWLQGSAFQLKVWEALLRIPEGHVSSYSALAQSIDKPRAARAVGSAIAKNPIALIIPCHRVIQQLGAVGGYRWGVERKKIILAHEALSNRDQ